jgi:hypothetical protein
MIVRPPIGPLAVDGPYTRGVEAKTELSYPILSPLSVLSSRADTMVPMVQRCITRFNLFRPTSLRPRQMAANSRVVQFVDINSGCGMLARALVGVGVFPCASVWGGVAARAISKPLGG